MAVYLAPSFGVGYQAFDTSGLPLNGGFVSTFAAGTATPLATWTTSTGAVANPTSITLGTDGRPPNEIWLTAATTYLFQLFTSSGVSIKSYDNIQGINDPANILPLSGGTMTGPITFSSTNPIAVDLLTGICEGRLTLTTGTPVTTANVTAAVTLFFSPYKGNRIALFDGVSHWNILSFSELSIAVPNNASQMFDVFVFNNAGTAALELLAWTNDTTRATLLTTQNGIFVKNGATTRRYIGSFRTTTVAGQTEDSLTKRYVWNYYNRVRRQMRAVDAAATWNYNTNAWRQANANAANQLDFVIGVSEDTVEAHVKAIAVNSAGVVSAISGIGLDITNAQNAQIFGATQVTNSIVLGLYADYENTIAAGRHFLAWLEDGVGGAGVTTWTGTDAGALGTSGINGKIWA